MHFPTPIYTTLLVVFVLILLAFHYGRFGLIFFQFQVLLVYLALQKLQNRNEKYKRNLSDVCQSWGNALRFILYT